jgi:superfamily I DNA/RNA helicase
MEVAADVLAAIDPGLEVPRSVRASGVAPWRRETDEAGLADAVAAAAVELAGQTGDGKLAVIVPPSRLNDLAKAVATVLPETAVGADPDLTSPVVVLTVRQAKGLEFDSVLIAEPGELLAESPRGRSDLYVALTRATQRVGVVHTGPVPDILARLTPA